MVALLLPAGIRAEALQGASLSLPIQGRPTYAPFSQAIGSFQVATLAAPTSVQAEDPITFTVRMRSTGPVGQAPERPELRDLPGFSEAFLIQDRTDLDHAAEAEWEFVYQLRPRTAAVKSIPSFAIVYYQPGMVPASSCYMTRWASEIPVQVRPREEVQAENVSNGNERPFPETVYLFTTDDTVLTHQGKNPWPGAVSLAALILGPPVLCLVWYLAWRRKYPHAARRVRIRRSQAALLAIKRFKATRRLAGSNLATAIAMITADYLHQRFDFPVAEPTPAELEVHLTKIGLTESLVERAVQLFRDCDAIRFLPETAPTLAPRQAALDLILAMEGET
jgi:hypothetical protein